MNLYSCCVNIDFDVCLGIFYYRDKSVELSLGPLYYSRFVIQVRLGHTGLEKGRTIYPIRTVTPTFRP